MAWFILIIAGLMEMTGVLMMNQWHQVKTKKSLITMLLCFALSFVFLAIALETLPMSIGYAIWTGIGAAGGAVIGILFYKESKSPKRIFFIALIILSVVGLKLIG